MTTLIAGASAPHSTDAASAPEPTRLYRFRVTADLCPQAMLRILGLVAQHNAIPRRIVCERLEDRLYAEVSVDGLTVARAEILLAKIAAIVTVRDARMTAS